MPIAMQIKAVDLDDGTTVNIVSYDDDSITIEVADGPPRFIRSQARSDRGETPFIRVVLAPVTTIHASGGGGR